MTETCATAWTPERWYSDQTFGGGLLARGGTHAQKPVRLVVRLVIEWQLSGVVRFTLFFVFTSGAVFLSAGTLAWWRGWLFLVIIAGAVASVTFGIFKDSPDLARERATAGKRAKAWDRILVPFISGIPFISVIAAGFGKRFGWAAPFSDAIAIAAAVVMALGALVTYLAMRANCFFSSHVRIQTDRGHQVIQSGPYGIVRHPGYVGAILVTLATPILLNSVVASWLALLTTLLTVIRTGLEDETLKRELPGYAAYVQRVRYRLVPLIW